MKIVKWSLITIAVVFVLFAAAIFVVTTYYKKELANLLVENLKSQYGLHLKVEKVSTSILANWPHATVELKDVTIENDQCVGGSEPLVRAGRISVSFDLLKLFSRQFIIKDFALDKADIFLITEKDGSKNFVFKKQPEQKASIDKKNAIVFELKALHMTNSHFLFRNYKHDQVVLIDLNDINVRIQNYLDGLLANFKGEVRVDQLLFKRHKGAFLRNKTANLNLKVIFDKERKTLCVGPGSDVEIEKEKYQVLTLLEFGDTKRLSMIMKTPSASLAKVSSLLTPRIDEVLSNFNLVERVKGEVVLAVNLGKRQDPVLIVNFESENNKLTIGKSDIPFTELRFKGSLVSLDSNHLNGNTETAKLMIHSITGKISAFPFSASVEVLNLEDPFLTVQGKLLAELEKLDFKVVPNFILLGSVSARINYSGPARGINIQQFLDKPMSLKADLRFNNFCYREINNANKYIVNGRARLENQTLFFDSLFLKTNLGAAVMKGKAENFSNFVLGRSNGFRSNIAARFDVLDLTPLFEKTDTPPVKNRNTKIEDLEKKESKKLEKKIAKINQFEFDVQVFAHKFRVKKMEAYYVTTNLHYTTNHLEVNNLALSACDGKITGKATIEGFRRLRADIVATNMNINKLFMQFENFGQTTIVAENLKGIINVEAKLNSDLDEKMALVGSSLESEVKLKIKEGHLINFEPVQKMSNLLFKNRDFNDVSFSELRETFTVDGSRMKLSEFEVASNVFDFFVVEGLYNFDGKSCINLLVPWSNLKRRGKDYVPKNSGDAANDAKGVKLNFAGPTNEMNLNFGHKTVADY